MGGWVGGSGQSNWGKNNWLGRQLFPFQGLSFTAVLDGVLLFLSVDVSGVVEWVSVSGAGRIFLREKKKSRVIFPVCKGERAEEPGADPTCEDSAEAPHPFGAHKHK